MRTSQEVEPWPTDGTPERLPWLDVRPDLADGVDPFERIIAFVDRLEPRDGGTGFVLEAPFDPQPLRRLLGSQGFTAALRQRSPRHWQVLFRRRAATAGRTEGATPRRWRDADGRHIDVRGMEAPEPLVAVLAALDDAAAGEAVIVHHDRDPMLLFPELAERGWRADYVDGEPGEVRLRLTRADGA
jgi:uncharacterized protein (DUF2249 family)